MDADAVGNVHGPARADQVVAMCAPGPQFSPAVGRIRTSPPGMLAFASKWSGGSSALRWQHYRLTTAAAACSQPKVCTCRARLAIYLT